MTFGIIDTVVSPHDVLTKERNTNKQEFPWQVAVFIDDMYWCGGSLLDDRHILTAAHCADGSVSFRSLSPRYPNGPARFECMESRFFFCLLFVLSVARYKKH